MWPKAPDADLHWAGPLDGPETTPPHTSARGRSYDQRSWTPADLESNSAVAVFGRVLFIAIGLTIVGYGIDSVLTGLRSTGSESFGQLDVASGWILIAIGSLVTLAALISLAWRLSSYYDPDD